MTFWIIVILLSLLAVLGLLYPLWRGQQSQTIADNLRREQNIQIAREQLAELKQQQQAGTLSEEEYQTTSADLEKALLADVGDDAPSTQHTVKPPRFTIATLALLVPVSSFALYAWLGTPAALQNSASPAASDNGGHASNTSSPIPADIDSMVASLEAKLQKDPQNLDGWQMLARSYMTMGRYPDAVKAYQKLLEQVPEDPNVMLMLADATAMSNQGKVTGKAEELVLKALEKSPDNITGLWLAGKAAFEVGDNARALEHWSKAEPLLPLGSDSRHELRNWIEKAGGALVPMPADNTTATPAPISQVPDINEMVANLRAKLEKEPQNPEGWLMLGRSYTNLQNYAEALKAYEQAHQQAPDSVEAMLGLADMLSMTSGGKLSGRASELIQKALQLAPQNTTALWLAGLAAQEAGNKVQAKQHWKTLLPLLTSPSEQAEVQQLIQQLNLE